VPTSTSGHLRLTSEYNTELARRAQPPAKVRSSLFHFHVGLWPIATYCAAAQNWSLIDATDL
jgi:hypothetical protein